MEYIPYILITLAALVITGLLTYYYARKDTPWIGYVATFVGWFFGFMIVALLPFDIYIVSAGQC